MWILRIISGPQAGTNFNLREGDNYIGRSDQLDICLNSKGVSKRHSKLIVSGRSISIEDLGSSNGTFVNGRMVQIADLQLGDRISFHQITAEILYNGANVNASVMEEGMNQNAFANEANTYDAGFNVEAKNQVKKPNDLKESIDLYVENVVMPALYRLIEQFELKWVLGVFVLAFAVIVSLLSTIPMIQISKSSIEKESQRRALSIARHIVDKNKALIERGLTSSLTVRSASREEGVKAALIIDADTGRVIAPASKAGTYESIPFVNLARDISKYKNTDYVETMRDSTIGASVPIRVYDPSKQTTSAFAYAVVIYDISTHSFDDGKAISLFIQTLSIALILGFVLFFLMNKLIEKPVTALNQEIDKAIKSGQNVSSQYIFPPLSNLTTNVNSLLARASGSNESMSDLSEDYSTSSNTAFEAQNVVRLFHQSAFAVDTEQNIIDCNTEFENLTGLLSGNLQQQSIEQLNDQAFILSVQDLMQRCHEQPSLIASNQLEFNGISMDVHAQAMSGAKGIEYYILTIKEQEGGDFV